MCLKRCLNPDLCARTPQVGVLVSESHVDELLNALSVLILQRKFLSMQGKLRVEHVRCEGGALWRQLYRCCAFSGLGFRV